MERHIATPGVEVNQENSDGNGDGDTTFCVFATRGHGAVLELLMATPNIMPVKIFAFC